jgi:hypothetical protein
MVGCGVGGHDRGARGCHGAALGLASFSSRGVHLDQRVQIASGKPPKIA